MAYCPKRILIAEDNKADVRLLKDILEGRGYETLQTGDGLEAISLALAHSPRPSSRRTRRPRPNCSAHFERDPGRETRAHDAKSRVNAHAFGIAL
jgi:CheY-like chemotaxis protein